MDRLRLLNTIFLIIVFGAFSIGMTRANYADLETSSGNNLSAGSVDISLRDLSNSEIISPWYSVTDIVPGYSEDKTIRVTKDGTLGFKYKLELVRIGGDDAFCDSLVFDAPLNTISTISGTTDDLDINVSLINRSASLQNKTCLFSFVVTAWQLDSDGTWGFRNEEILNNSIASGVWDTTPPVISSVQHLIATPGTDNQPTATITWTTNEMATSNLRWSTDSTEGPWTTEDTDPTADNLNHSRTIDGLTPDTTYYYQVISADGFGNESVAATQTFQTGSTRPGIPIWSDVVINEFLPNPVGADNAPRPGGEWVELYNNSNSTINLMGWYLRNASGNRLNLTVTNSTGSSISPHGFVVVYRDGNSGFSLRNSVIGDMLRLYDNHNWIRDLHTYTAILGDEVLENKSFARFPDGSSTWFDPIPTPNGPNILEPELSLSVSSDRRYASFHLINVDEFVGIAYELIYGTDSADQGLTGADTLANQAEYTKNNLLLGSCSTGGTCIYHSGVNNLRLKVKLINSDGAETNLEKVLE